MQDIIGAHKAVDAAVVFEATQENFAETVIEASQEQPIIVDFWAPWCEPCKTMMPALEAAVRATKGAVRLAKINVDENQAIAQQLRVQSIPAVFAFYQGRPIDGFTGAVPESQLTAFVAKAAAAAGPAAIDELVVAGEEALKTGDIATASQAFGQALQEDPAHPQAAAGMARCFIEAGQLDHAKSLLTALPEDVQAQADVARVLASLALKEGATEVAGEMDGLKAKVDAAPDDHQARIDLAAALAAVDAQEEAIDQLIASITRDRDWNDALARKELLKLFDVFGPMAPVTLKGRRKLSSVLFS